ncbi:acidic leucine-rich nuclear phospho 32-related [Olea europaea subsp. europaea]|uniref:Acidic leucine-rich nuclear phospho 32-related n=1 Tax=Olea europaea subsp. europaea TaxID=158383 RepID=A0A8S0PAL0_OLEEU|nr:acidic leucine-rich nuclear phospho 32-related [Olea europaea subsp. europaea]
MDEIWERAVETALDGQTDVAAVRTLTLDGAVKCVHGRLPPPALFEKFQSLQHLSIANIGVSSLEQFPRLRNLLRLILSDNRIAGGLKFLVEAGLESLRDLDLSNNRISDINDLRPLAELRLVSLDLYECPVTRVKDYRSRVFGLIKSLKYLDKTDAEGNERPESDDDDEEEEDDDDEEDDDPGSGEIDGGEDRPLRLNNGNRAGSEGVVDVDEDEESDADEEEAETSRGVNGISSGGSSHHQSNGFRVEAVNAEDDEDSVEEVYEDEGDDDEDVVEVHEIDDSDDDDGVDDDEEDDDEEVDNDEGDLGEPASTRKFTSTEGEIDGHEQGEDDVDEDDNGETGEEDEEGVEEDGDFEDDEEAEDEEDNNGTGYLVQPVGQVEADAGGGDLDPVNEGEEPELEEDEDEDGEVQELPPAAAHKRKRDDEDGDGDEEEEDVDAHHSKSSKHH